MLHETNLQQQFRPVAENPVLRLSQLRHSHASLRLFEHSRVEYFGYGRTALRVGLGRLAFKPGDNALVPDFICDEAIEPFRYYGIEPRFYRVEGLKINFAHAATLVDGHTRAFMAVHYFGLPQDIGVIRDFCQSHALKFIEDNAHGLMSEIDDGPLGTFGDIGIFSFRKTLPVPDGSALVMNAAIRANTRLGHDSCLQRWRRWTAFGGRTLVRNVEVSLGIPLVVRAKWRRIGRQVANEIESVAAEAGQTDAWTWSALSRRIIERIDLEGERQTRMAAYQFWCDQANRQRIPGAPLGPTELPAGVVPQAFPLSCEQPWKAIDNFRRAGIEAYAWPGQRPVVSGQTARVAVCIPLHQRPILVS